MGKGARCGSGALVMCREGVRMLEMPSRNSMRVAFWIWVFAIAIGLGTMIALPLIGR
jgi:hypothetical protein